MMVEIGGFFIDEGFGGVELWDGKDLNITLREDGVNKIFIFIKNDDNKKYEGFHINTKTMKITSLSEEE